MMEKSNIKAHGIGGSDIAAIRGFNDYVTPFQIWQQKTGKATKGEISEKQLIGIKIEPFILQMGVDKINQEGGLIRLTHERLNKEMFTKEIGIVAVPDAFARLDYDEIIISLKNTQQRIESVEDIPVYWIEQINWELGICGLKTGIIFYLKNGSSIGSMGWKLQEDLFEEQLESARNFWHNHVLADVAPEPVNAEDVLEMFPKSNAKSIVADDGIVELHKALGNVRKELTRLEKEEEIIIESIKMKMLDNEVLISPEGKPLFTWKGGEETTKLDSKKLKETYPEIVEECSTTSTTPRKFLFKPLKDK